MKHTLAILTLLALAACNGNTSHPVGAPTGIRAQSGGGTQQLDRVPGNNAQPNVTLGTTVVK